MKKYFVLAIIAILFATIAPLDIQTSVSDGTGKCSSNLNYPFIQIGQNYYLIDLSVTRTWHGAVHYCRTKGAHLTSIESGEEWYALSSYLISNNIQLRFWIGGNDIDTPFQFFWISTGQPMHFTGWLEGEPNNAGGTERCVHIGPIIDHYVMNDWDCQNDVVFICKANNPKTVEITVW